MIEFLSSAFSWVCGQNPDHTWAPGGWLLPCCQRCTGLYLGILLAAALHLWLKPRITHRFLEIHGLLLLQMVPFGYHWLPQGPVLRTVTGILFGFGVATFLWLMPAARFRTKESARSNATLRYFLSLAAGVVLVPTLAALGGVDFAKALSWLAFAGAGALLVLVLANGVLWTLGVLPSFGSAPTAAARDRTRAS